jgi:hypothetical protein
LGYIFTTHQWATFWVLASALPNDYLLRLLEKLRDERSRFLAFIFRNQDRSLSPLEASRTSTKSRKNVILVIGQ